VARDLDGPAFPFRGAEVGGHRAFAHGEAMGVLTEVPEVGG
jgi:hypothetical protein